MKENKIIQENDNTTHIMGENAEIKEKLSSEEMKKKKKVLMDMNKFIEIIKDYRIENHDQKLDNMRDLEFVISEKEYLKNAKGYSVERLIKLESLSKKYQSKK